MEQFLGVMEVNFVRFRRLLSGLAVTVVLAAIAASAGQARPTAAKAPGTLTFGMGGIPSTGDPFAFLAPPGLFLYHAVFDGLTQLDTHQRVVGALATSWQQVGSNKWVFTLRKGVTFQNGEPFDAAAVKFTYDYLLKNPTKPAALEAAAVASVQAASKYTVVITTKQPDALLPRQAAAVFIVPPQAYQSEGTGFATKPVGTGNFKVTEFVPNDHITLQATPSWRGAPKTSTIVFRRIPDPATRIQALRSGQIDIAQGVSPDDTLGLESAGFKVLNIPRAQVQQITFETTTAAGPWQNKLVRQAMNYAVDRATIVKLLLGGTTKAAAGQIVGPDAFGFNPQLKPYPYDPQKAKQLLAQAGYQDGFKVTMQATVGNFPNDKQAYEAVASYLGRVGIDVNFQVITLSDWLARFYAGPRGPLWVEGLQYLPEIDSSKALDWYRCSQPAATRHFCDPRLDRTLNRAAATLSEKTRKTLLQQANAIFRDDAPAIMLWQLTDSWALRDSITGWVARPDAVLPLDTLKG